jgi:hypothetical protein
MTKAMLLQLPIPQINFGKTTANVPLAAACLKQSAAGIISCPPNQMLWAFQFTAGISTDPFIWQK